MSLPKRNQDESFLKELILCVCQKSADPTLGATKFKTLLDVSGFLPYAAFRKPVVRFDQETS